MASNLPLSLLLSSGSDAFTNLFDVKLTGFPSYITTPTTDARFSTVGGTTNKVTYLAPTKNYSTDQSLSLRIDGFTPPEITPLTYDVHYKGVSMPRLAPAFSGQERTFELKIRLDGNWDIYNWLLWLKRQVVDPSADGNITFGQLTTGNSNSTGGKVSVVAYQAQGSSDLSSFDYATATGTDIVAQWDFTDVFCTEVGIPVLKRTGGNIPVSVTTRWLFGGFAPPQAK